ncbi:MAG TPA: transcriptional regulator NrdR [Candidatus Blautia stercoravium]|nr:transcriptional regulator NrdR [Candidatus Blautia stercoravium]
MKCPFCNQENTRVIDSRPVPDNNSIRRRRQCDECGKRFTTYEKIETIPLTVIKKDQSREQYDRMKIQGGIMRACYKRPISVKTIENLMDEIETEIFNKEEKEVPSTLIGEIVMDKLKELDAVAYVRFASVYREFKDIDTFMDELKKMMK